MRGLQGVSESMGNLRCTVCIFWLVHGLCREFLSPWGTSDVSFVSFNSYVDSAGSSWSPWGTSDVSFVSFNSCVDCAGSS